MLQKLPEALLTELHEASQHVISRKIWEDTWEVSWEKYLLGSRKKENTKKQWLPQFYNFCSMIYLSNSLEKCIWCNQ